MVFQGLIGSAGDWLILVRLLVVFLLERNTPIAPLMARKITIPAHRSTWSQAPFNSLQMVSRCFVLSFLSALST